MPSFPTSVFAPTNKTAGQTIQAAHINDLQDEVVAIEGGYLNGTARLNSSASTVASLGVTGHSTVAGRLVVSSGLSVVGNSTLGSSIALGTIPYVFPSSGGSTGDVLTCISTSGSTMGLEWRAAASVVPPAVRVSQGASNALSIGSSLNLTWNTQDYVTNSSLHSTTTNSSRLTPDSTGIWQFTAHIAFSQDNTGWREIRLLDSSAGSLAKVQIPAVVGSTWTQIQCQGTKRFDATGGWVKCSVFVSGPSTASLPGGNVSWFAMVKL